MTRFDPHHRSLDLLKLNDTVIVLSGGATGIGAATVRQFYSHGARVVFGDVNTEAAEAVVSSTSSERVHFFKTDVRSYQQVRALFQFALERYGHVDHAIANAGILEKKGWFDPELQDMGEAPTTMTLDINLTGVLYFAHLACFYTAQRKNNGVLADRSLTLLSSHGGFKETPGMFVYGVTKHGVMGLLRSLRPHVLANFPGLRVNAVCPSMTETGMVDGIKDGWVKNGLPVNRPEDIATAMVGIAAAGPGTEAIWHDENESPNLRTRKSVGSMDWDNKDQGLHGRAIFVLGGQCYDIEEGLERTEQIWLGKSVSEKVKLAQEVLGLGGKWTGK